MAFTAGYVRKLGYWVVYDPMDEDPDHHYIYNPIPPHKESLLRKDARALAKSSEYEWAYQPENLLTIALAKK